MTLQFSGRWIPVTERLPDDDITVMLATPGIDKPWILGHREDGEWRNRDGWFIYRVTHWAEMVPGPQGCGTDGVPTPDDAQRIADLEEEVRDVRRWYGDRLEILSAWAREHLKGEQLDTFFNIAANARPHHTDEPAWFRAVVEKLAVKRAASGVLEPRKPDGYAYAYDSPFGGIRFNNGEPVNGSKPTRAIPYWLGAPPNGVMDPDLRHANPIGLTPPQKELQQRQWLAHQQKNTDGVEGQPK